MNGSFKDKQHLLRMAGLFAIGVGAFFVLQLVLVPKGFGVYGHYRAGAVGESAAKPVAFAGRAQCARCHGPQLETLSAGKHAGIGCEGCHGPLAKHAAAPSSFKPVKPAPAQLCPVCHEANIAKPKGFPQQDTKEHSGGESCDSCHTSHAPTI